MLRTTTPARARRLDELLEPALVARLSNLDIASRRVFAGKLKGERRSKKKGQSVEFADHRQYVVGDDLRRIDWNLFGRLDRLFLKLFLEEEDLSVHVVLDATASLDTGQPSKFLCAQRLAAAVACVGLVGLNRVALSAVAGGQTLHLRDLRGRRRLHDVARFILGIEPGGGADFSAAARRIALARRGKGVMVFISDFLFKEGYETPLRLLAGHGYDLFALQVLSPQEIDPPLGGDLKLKDLEDGDVAELTITAPLLKRYRANLAAYQDRLHGFCAARGITHLLVRSEADVGSLVFDQLRRRGLVA
ncbi:MAG TPA: DUF58 domain-containing protein [Phycisphaerales bacterium]|nr:DUF58 domain-containing protein [Phycisphaerales bacterium]